MARRAPLRVFATGCEEQEVRGDDPHRSQDSVEGVARLRIETGDRDG